MVPLPTPPLTSGLHVLHGNRLEHLLEAVASWLQQYPLAPLEEELFIVQSQGMGEWLKMELAATYGICAATRVELPAQFIWEAYRTVLGPEAVPVRSPLDKLALTWRFMALLPQLLALPPEAAALYAPVAGFLAAGSPADGESQRPLAGDPARRLQLAERLADLFDQYQVYRQDWLADWAQGSDTLRSPSPRVPGGKYPVPAEQCWQPALWRAVLQTLPDAGRGDARPDLQRAFLAQLQPAAAVLPGAGRLPRRVVVFGTTHVPPPTLEALAALAGECQVLMAVPNPCQYYWADLIEGRELLKAPHHRHALRAGSPELRDLPLEAVHAHGHPLLAAWGRQARDFIRLLDHHDDRSVSGHRFGDRRADLFDDPESPAGLPAATLLGQVQGRIRDLVPLGEAPPAAPAPEDRSIVFHSAHSAQREVEILHDQLLQYFAQPPGGAPLNPRDVVVMVPDVALFEPAIHSVFGQHDHGADRRRIPYCIADLQDRGRAPLLVALEWLLSARVERFTLSGLRALLDVPAVREAFSLDAAALPVVSRWLEGAGVRWGLHAEHRAALGLGECGAQNTWAFGLRRLLLGYAIGSGTFAEIEADGEVAGLEAEYAGPLADLMHVLENWWAEAGLPRTPQAWSLVLRRLLRQLFKARDDHDKALLMAADEALARWLDACDAAGFHETLDLLVVSEAWLAAIDDPSVARRFRAGGVTFCTLLPLRAIPFEVVCLLGMNDADYPRRSARNDFDLMALPEMARPGDRSRRDDDRQLMLDALLSARKVLYVSWAGHSPRDNTEQPPSVLVAQLRDYLAATWSPAAVQERTVQHPLQPFSRRYFDQSPGLFTYAKEWRAAHQASAIAATAPSASPFATEHRPSTLSVADLCRFLQNPVREFFKQRLAVEFPRLEAEVADEEMFVANGLEQWTLADDVLDTVRALGSENVAHSVEQAVARLQRAGRLALGGPGLLQAASLRSELGAMLRHWQAQCALQPLLQPTLRLRWSPPLAADRLVNAAVAELVLADELSDVRSAGHGAPLVFIELQASRLATAQGVLRADKLLAPWLRGLLAAACGQPLHGVLIGRDGWLMLPVFAAAAAQHSLGLLLGLWQAGVQGAAPLPAALQTGIAVVQGGAKAAKLYEGDERWRGEREEPCLARTFPDHATLAAAPGFVEWAQQLYGDYAQWLEVAPALQAYAGCLLEAGEGHDDD